MSTPPAPALTPAQWSMTVTPVVAALTTLCAATALSGVIDGLRWLGYAGVAVVVVTATGLGLRAVRTPIIVVGFAQMFAVLCLLVALFTNSGIAGVLPGPAALTELGDVLQRSVEVVRDGVPPVEANSAVLCLVVIAIGLVAVLVDTLAVAAGTPAACGLVLLCVYAVPASLADEMLPWWSFVLGASSFALLLAVDGAHRHQQWRNRPALPGTGVGVGSPAAHVSAALAVALLAGATITAIGTVGQLPGGTGGGGSGGLGLKPFTSLRGMLDQGSNRELFRVRGLSNEPRYMRVMTLHTYDGNGGWALGRGTRPEMPRGESTARDLNLPPGDELSGPTTRIEVEVVDHEDYWAPVYGTPRRMLGLPNVMRYDPASGMVYSDARRKLPTFVQESDLSQPSVDDLRQASTDYSPINPEYLEFSGIDPRVMQLASELTAGQPTQYDKAVALAKYFDGNGFTYELQTATGNDQDALTDFLFRSKAGFCEQYASALAILARAAGLPSRVAMGYTAGFLSGDYRSITTKDAHAWVEIFFPGQGWVLFDPTPLTDGRTFTPPYATPTDSATSTDDPTNERATTSSAPGSSGVPHNVDDRPDPDSGSAAGQAPQGGQPAWVPWAAGATALAALLLTMLIWLALRGVIGPGGTGNPLVRRLIPIAATSWLLTIVFVAAVWSWWLAILLALLTIATAPSVIRGWRRHSHRHAVVTHRPTAATAAWAELLAESMDRGAERLDAETVRSTARRLAHEHGLDDDGKRALRTVVGAVERAWYGGRSDPDPALAAAFNDLLAALRRSAPLALREKLLPRSVLRPLHRRVQPRYTAG